MNVRHWFRSRRDLIALLTARDEEVAEYGEAIAAIMRRVARRELRTAELEAELKKQRARTAELQQQLENAWEYQRAREGVGMMRHEYNLPPSRLINQPIPWKVHDEIQLDAAAKRLADGLGD